MDADHQTSTPELEDFSIRQESRGAIVGDDH
jgi:hypothetical protein